MAAFALLTLVSGTLLAGSSALAVHAEGLFELDTSNNAAVCAPLPAPCGDANVADDAGTPGDDWATIFAGGGSAFASSFIPDPVSSAETSFYTGGGSKDVRDIPLWAYGTTNDVIPDKDDIADAFVAAYNTGGATPETIIYFGIDRYDNNGDAETGFWFFQEEVSLGANGQFNGVHTVGDVLVLANWGGSNPVGEITVYQWMGGKNPLVLVADNLAADCATIGTNDNVCAVVNRQVVDPPWTFLDKGGSQNIRSLELFEAGINLTALFGEDICFGSFLASTRSSHSPTAQLKDFALGPFEQCGAAISIGPSAVNEVGEQHTFTVSVTKSTGSSTSPAEGVIVDVDLTAANGAAVDLISDTCASPGTDSAGECEVTFTSDTAGTITGHASASVTIGDDIFAVETDGVAPNSGDAVKRFVDARVSIAPDDVNEINENHTFTVTAQQNLGLGGGWVSVPDGTIVTVALADSNGSTVQTSSDTCASPGTSGGTCSVTFTSPTAGLVTGNASFSITIGGNLLTRDTAGNAGPGGSDGADKRFVDAFITINPPLATNTVGDPHTFTVNVQQNAGDGLGFVDVPDNTIVTVTLTPSAGATIQLISDTCAGPGTVGGECAVTFSSSTSGTVTGHASVDLTIQGEAVHRETDGIAPNSGDAVKHFVAGSIAWTKVDNAGALQGGATFEVCKTHDFTLPAGPFVDLVPDDCFDVADNGAVDEDPADGKFLISGLSLGRYTVHETIAPPGFVPDPDTVTVELTPGNTEQVIAEAFVNSREVLKITGFGYTNAPVGTPTSGVTHGIAVFTVTLHNYGTAAANLTNSSLVVTGATCTGGNTLALTGVIAAGADSPTYTLTCEYDGADGDVVQADLVVKSTTNGLEREASGSPARITFTIQAD